MIIQNLQAFFKHLSKNKLYTAITVFGFAISLSFIILLSVFIKQETSVDQFHAKKDRIYRLVHERNSYFAPPVGDLLQTKFPEIESYSRFYNKNGIVLGGNDQKLKMDYLMADSTFFNIFSFRIIEGSRKDALRTKESIVLSRSFAYKLFGSVSPIGQEVVLDREHRFTVSAVMEDFPDNTHFKKYDAMVNFKVLADLWGWKELLTSYGNCSFGLYFLAKENTDLPAKAPQVLEMFKKDFWLYKEGYAKTVNFEPLTDSYFSESESREIRRRSKTLISLLTGIVFLILIIAIINYINLTIAQSGFRGKETVIKKIMGSSRGRLFAQFVTESILLCFLAFIIAVFISLAVEPGFNQLLNTRLNLTGEFTIRFLLIAVGAVVLIGGISGIIPAIAITGFCPTEVLKGALRKRNRNTYGKLLIAFQFTIAIGLLICAWMISKQAVYLQNYNLGFKKENILWIDYEIDRKQKATLKDILTNIAGVEEVSYVAGSPIDGGNNQSYNYNGKSVSFQEFVVDTVFLSMLEMEVTLTGAAYSKDAVFINETAVKELELEPLPTKFKFYKTELPVYGVVKDFNFRGLYQKVGPAIIRQMDAEKTPWTILVKISAQNVMETTRKIEKAYDKFTGGMPITLGFLDETINQWYQKEKNTSRLIAGFTLLTIILSVMGVLAMATYYLQQRVKEIGIRKANGATTLELLKMLNMDFVKWVAIAFVLACPVAYYIIAEWLKNFAYKTEISWWVFVLSGIAALGVALLTVSWQTWKAASRNPATALQYE